MLPTLHVSAPEVMLQFGAVVLAASIVQDKPAVLGSASVTLTPVAVPAPLLVTVSLKPMGSPALTEAASAVLTILTSAQLTVTESELSPEPSFVDVTLPVLWIVQHLADVAGDVRCTT